MRPHPHTLLGPLAALVLAAGCGSAKRNPTPDASADAEPARDRRAPDLGFEDPDGGLPDAEPEDTGADAGPGDTGPAQPPTRSTAVASAQSGGFRSPMAAAYGPDGTILFTGFTGDDTPALFQMRAGSTPRPVHTGTPFELPVGVAVSADGLTGWVADLAAGTRGAVFTVALATGAVRAEADLGDLMDPAGLAYDGPGRRLLVTGTSRSAGTGVIYALPLDGGAATELPTNGVLGDPSAIALASSGNIYVYDVFGPGGLGRLRRFTSARADVLVRDLAASYPAGLALADDEGFALITTATTSAGGGSLLERVSLPAGRRETLPLGAHLQDAHGLAAGPGGRWILVDGAPRSDPPGTIYELSR